MGVHPVISARRQQVFVECRSRSVGASMTDIPVGGPSTINGVLYQMLWCLFRTARLHVSECSVDDSSGQIARAALCLEPTLGAETCRKSWRIVGSSYN